MGRESILFSHWDGGRGHITRILDVAEEAKRRGIKIGLITTQSIKESLPFAFDEVYTIPTRPSIQATPTYDLPLYSHARSHGQRLTGLGFTAENIIAMNLSEIAAIDNFRPSVIVNDYRDTIKNAADIRQIPVIGIVQSNGHEDGQPLGWFTKVAGESPSKLDAFNEARTHFNIPAISDERTMFMGDFQIVPSIREIDPISTLSDDSYVGILSYQFNPSASDATPQPKQKYVVANITAGNRTSYGQRHILEGVSEIEPIDCISTGEKVPGSLDICKALGRVLVRSFVSYEKTLPSSVAFLSYGGHGSTLNALSLGVPVIGVGPFSSEQRGTLENLALFGAGVVIPHQPVIESIAADDMGGRMIYGNWTSSITPTAIVAAVHEVENSATYRSRAVELSNRLNQQGGAVQAVDIITDI